MNSEDLKKIREALYIATQEISFDTITAAREALRLFDAHVAALSQQEAEPVACEDCDEGLCTMDCGPAIYFHDALQVAESGFREWADKPHNSKWVKRISGTPIENDLLVCIARKIVYQPKPAPLPQPVASVPHDVDVNNSPKVSDKPSCESKVSDKVPQSVEEFIAEHGHERDCWVEGVFRTDSVISTRDLRALMAGKALVPVEPTEKMLDAGVAMALQVSVHGQGGWSNYVRDLYKQMLAASQEGV